MGHIRKSAALLCVLAYSGSALADDTAAGVEPIGPDVIVGDIHDLDYNGVVGNIRSYSIGTTSCNVGDEVLKWNRNTPDHPVIAQNLYRISNGRIEQIGQSWPKHGWCAVSGRLCGTCGPSNGCLELGVGCSDPYSAFLNGIQDDLGPKSEVNATTGVFPYPYILGWNQTGNAIYKRVQVPNDLIDPNLNADAVFIAESQYIHPEDAQAGNDLNNASYRRVSVNPNFSLSLRDTTQREIPAIFAWRDHGNGANVPDPTVEIMTADVVDDGRFFIAGKVTDNLDGTWTYTYAIQNFNSHQSGQSFSVPVPADAKISNVGFRDVDYHSGEPYTNDDWTATISNGRLTWGGDTFAQNQDANALRWNTLYTFWFTANAAPVDSEVTLGLFRPGTVDSVSVGLQAPAGISCSADWDGNGIVNAADVGAFITTYFENLAGGGDEADFDGNGVVNAADVGAFLTAYFDQLVACG